MNKFKKFYIMRLIVSTLVGVALGFLFLLLRPWATEIFDILLIALGLITVLLNIPSLVLSLLHIKEKGEWINLTVSVAAIALGVFLILLQNQVVLLILAIYSLALPLLKILLVRHHFVQFRRELPKIIIGAALLTVLLAEAESVVFLISGIACFAISVCYLIYGLLLLHYRYHYFQ